jgi:pimeloyl-ACP methyl ester carboxylesterase
LFGAYSSILDVVKDTIPYKEVTKLFSERWDSKENIGQVTCPILMMHGQNDGLIKPSHADTLHSRNRNARLIKMPLSGHTTLPYGECIKEVKKWLKEHDIMGEHWSDRLSGRTEEI